jgi:hypothetical protein
MAINGIFNALSYHYLCFKEFHSATAVTKCNSPIKSFNLTIAHYYQRSILRKNGFKSVRRGKMPNNSSALNRRIYLNYLFIIICSPLGFARWNYISSWHPNLAVIQNFVGARSIFVFFTPAFLIREPSYGAF